MSGGDYNEVARSSSKYSVEGNGGKPAADAAMEGGIEDAGRNAVHFCTRLFEKNLYVVSLMTFLTMYVL